MSLAGRRGGLAHRPGRGLPGLTQLPDRCTEAFAGAITFTKTHDAGVMMRGREPRILTAGDQDERS